MNNLHPHLAAALAPFMQTPRPTPLECFHFELLGVDFDCRIEYEPAERGSRTEPGAPHNAILHKAIYQGADFFEFLSDDQREEIEIAFLKTDKEY